MSDTLSSRRKLSVIFDADVAGYSRLMAQDEAATVAALNRARAVFRRHIEARHGRILDTSGDSVLAEFSSAVEAVNAAVEIQKELECMNASEPEPRRMRFRIGVHFGDVIEHADSVYGEDVNTAVSLQERARPGGVCISATVLDHVVGKIPLRASVVGEPFGFGKRPRAYAVDFEAESVGGTHLRLRRWAIAVVVTTMLCLACVAYLWTINRHGLPSGATSQDLALAMPSGPVIAVLPFSNMSKSRTQDYFADGLTQDVITELARFKEFYVLGRNVTTPYRNGSMDAAEVGRLLKANYVIEGSVRRAGNRVRVTAQLVDTTSGAHLWAEKYDRDIQDVFVIQDDIANRIAAAVTGGSRTAIPKAIGDASLKKKPSEIRAYEHVLRAGVFFHTWSKDNYEVSKHHLEKAIELAPDYARARHLYAYTLLVGWISHFEESPAPPSSIIANAVRSVELDPTDYRAHRTAAFGHFFDKNLGLFDQHATRAIEIAPNDAEVLAEMGALYTISGNWDRGPGLVRKAYNLNRDAAGGWYHAALHYDYFRRGRFREALDIVVAHPDQGILHTQWKYVAAYAELGDIHKAREHFEKCRKIDPTWSADRMRQELRLWNVPEDFINVYLASYAKAGFRETGRI
jgi:adenylate cyclase